MTIRKIYSTQEQKLMQNNLQLAEYHPAANKHTLPFNNK